jgi:hypothetical protein
MGFDGVEWSPSAGNDKIAWGPEVLANCGHTAHADVHTAQEIRRRGIEVLIAEGLSVSACGELCVSTSVKQEETPALPRVRSENQNRPQRAA